MSELSEEQERVAAVLQTTAPRACPGSVLTGWVVVAEWMDPNGETWLSGLKDQNTSIWKRDGMLHHVLYGDMEGDED